MWKIIIGKQKYLAENNCHIEYTVMYWYDVYGITVHILDGRLVLIGVVGRGIGCARFNEPGRKSINHVFYPMIYSTKSDKKVHFQCA